MANELERMLESLDSDFEQSNFEDSNFNLQSKAVQTIKALPPTQQKVIMQALAVSKDMGRRDAEQKGGIVTKIGNATPSDVQSLVAQSIGDLNITVTRVGTNVDSVLPFILFGANDTLSKYATTMKSLKSVLPVGTTFALTINDAGDYVFTYTFEGNSDTVTVKTLGNTNYQSFISAMNNNFFATKYVLISTTKKDSATEQFAEPLLYGKLSALGLTGANQMILRSRQNSWMYQTDRIEVVMPEQSIVPDFSFAMNIIKVEGMTLGFDFFMSRRINLNGM